MLIEKISTKKTPLEIFDGFAGENYSIFLDSSDENPSFGRYSFIFTDPFYKFTARSSDCFSRLRRALAKVHPCPSVNAGANQPFNEKIPAGAAAGYFSYDAGLRLEKIKTKSYDELKWPLIQLGFYDAFFFYDHLHKNLYALSTGLPETTPRKKSERAKRRLDLFMKRILRPTKGTSADDQESGEYCPASDGMPQISSNFTKSRYVRAVNRIKEYIAAGDVYQVNLSRRFYSEINLPPYVLYKNIRWKNRVPFGAYLNFGRKKILSFSMERFLKIKGQVAETRPIKGTAPRGKNRAQDERNARGLFSSEKNKAELLMIVDLERNDLGRVCEYGSVHVDRLYEIEKYATVFHLVSTIRGKIASGRTPLDCLTACFPGGSITGAPKIRSMEIIDELEKTGRGVYCGSIGYMGFDGTCDINVAIRTIVIDGKKAVFNSGGGITYDSNPVQEYEETIHKVRTFLDELKYHLSNVKT